MIPAHVDVGGRCAYVAIAERTRAESAHAYGLCANGLLTFLAIVDHRKRAASHAVDQTDTDPTQPFP